MHSDHEKVTRAEGLLKVSGDSAQTAAPVKQLLLLQTR